MSTELGMDGIMIWPDIRLLQKPDTGYPAGFSVKKFGRLFKYDEYKQPALSILSAKFTIS
jgi:hypothetical protein